VIIAALITVAYGRGTNSNGADVPQATTQSVAKATLTSPVANPTPTENPTSIRTSTRPQPTPTLVIVQDEVGIPASGTEIKRALSPGQILMFGGGQFDMNNAKWCHADPQKEICILLYSATKAETVVISNVVEQQNRIAIAIAPSPDDVLNENERLLWKPPNCKNNGCTSALIHYFTDGQLTRKETRFRTGILGSGVLSQGTYSDGLAPFAENTIPNHLNLANISPETSSDGCGVADRDTEKIWFGSSQRATLYINDKPVGEIYAPTGQHGYIFDVTIHNGDRVCVKPFDNVFGYHIRFGNDMYYQYGSYCYRHPEQCKNR
jgi:hypothetical protein